MNRLAQDGLLGSLTKIDLPLCTYCLVRKAMRKYFGKALLAKYPLQLIHFDICSKISVRERHDALYFITFVDDFS